MLQIRLKRDPSSEGAGARKPSPAEGVTVACPDHLVLADLPVGKGLGIASSVSAVKVVGRKSRRQLGERVHFCVRCDFPIAIYGRLSPCDHAFCLDCARSDSICYLCDERIQKIQTIKMMEGIFVCAAPHCLKSFMKKPEFESHIHETHSDLIHPNADKDDGNESESRSLIKQSSTVSESTARAPSRPPPGFSPMQHDREDNNKSRHRPMMMQQKPPSEAASWDPPPPFMMPNPMMTAPPLPFGFPPFQQPDGAQPFYNAPPESGPEQGSLLGFPPGGMNFTGNYPQPWNPTPTGGGGFEPPLPLPLPQSIGQEVPGHGSSGPSMDLRDGKGVLATQPPMPPLQPPPVAVPSHLPQMNRGNFYQQGDGGPGYGWQHENQD